MRETLPVGLGVSFIIFIFTFSTAKWCVCRKWNRCGRFLCKAFTASLITLLYSRTPKLVCGNKIATVRFRLPAVFPWVGSLRVATVGPRVAGTVSVVDPPRLRHVWFPIVFSWRPVLRRTPTPVFSRVSKHVTARSTALIHTKNVRTARERIVCHVNVYMANYIQGNVSETLKKGFSSLLVVGTLPTRPNSISFRPQLHFVDSLKAICLEEFVIQTEIKRIQEVII